MSTKRKLAGVSTEAVLERVGTLCDEPNGLTCSFDAAKRWSKAQTVLPYATFEQAAEDVKDGRISGVLVPCAYPRLNFFIMDSGLMAKETFITRTPPLVVVGIDKAQPEGASLLFHHPATMPLLPEVPIAFLRNEFVSSNSMACKALLQMGPGAIAITNGLCASFYRLNTYKVLRAGLMMPFICFVKP